ncbi:MAG: regulator of ribonuclease activity A [Halieaceae bacterium]|jgi:regulator of ribonuclease activity A
MLMLSTPDLCDKHPERVQIMTPILTSYGGRDRFCGEIVTVKCFEDNSKVKQLAAESGAGKVLVIDGGGSLRRALLGDMIAANAVENGWQGMVINGCVRDVEVLAELDLGVMALAAIPMKTEKMNIGDINVTVNFGGLEFQPGHYIYADRNGVLVSPSAL